MKSYKKNFLIVSLKDLLCETQWLNYKCINSITISKRKRAHFFVAGSMDTYSMPEGKAHVAPMGEAPAYVNTQHFPLQAGPAVGSSAESSPRKDLFDMSGFPFTFSFLFF